MFTRNTHVVQKSIYNYQNSYPLTLHYTKKHNSKNESIYLKVTVYVKPQGHEENEHARKKNVYWLNSLYVLIMSRTCFRVNPHFIAA